MSTSSVFEIELDAAASAWIDSHLGDEPRVIVYEVHRCCGGGKICEVQVRQQSRRDDISTYATAVMKDGAEIGIDPRAAARLPSRFRLTVRGLGRFKHLDLDLDGEQWGALLYD
ncbi:MAG TPA: hypothetical protein VGS16_05405 [Candidatus Dormibacteraeota bacterium]|nr:hypothetical protein [Candidatus Dormibacteraeota bacterium]